MTETSSKRHRKNWRLLISPLSQGRVIFWTAGLSTLILSAFFAIELKFMADILRNLARSAELTHETRVLLLKSIKWAWIGFWATAVPIGGITLFSALLISHRIFGPLFAIRKHLHALLADDLQHRTRLRANSTPDFHETAMLLNRVSDHLAGKKENPS